MPKSIWVLEQGTRSLDFVWKLREDFCEVVAFKLESGGSTDVWRWGWQLAFQAKSILRERMRKHGKSEELKGQRRLEMQLGPDQGTTEGQGKDAVHPRSNMKAPKAWLSCWNSNEKRTLTRAGHGSADFWYPVWAIGKSLWERQTGPFLFTTQWMLPLKYQSLIIVVYLSSLHRIFESRLKILCIFPSLKTKCSIKL